MLKCGNRVLYGMHGVCEIVNTEIRRIGGKSTEYYVLQPIGQTGSRYYVPAHNPAALAKIRPILTQKEINDLLQSACTHDEEWIEDDSQRKQHYSSLITSTDRAALVRTVHTIHKRKAQLSATGKKLHLCDENFLRDAERLLGEEFSVVLDIAYNDVGKYVKSIIEK